jgi:hypothetical protein
MPTISADEIAGLYRSAAAGNVAVRLLDPAITWSDTYNGYVGFRIAGWTVVFFYDSGELDYTEEAIAPDGRQCEDWYGSEWPEFFCPLDLLSPEEEAALARRCKQAT